MLLSQISLDSLKAAKPTPKSKLEFHEAAEMETEIASWNGP